MAAVTNLYARAFADVVFSAKLDAAKTTTDLSSLAETVRGSYDLRKVWSNPAVSFDQKIKILDALAAKMELVRQMRNFTAILIEKRRIGLLSEIAEQVKVELNERMGFVNADITSARDLAADEKTSLEAQLGRVTGKKVHASYAQDASLLGGAMIKVGSTIYDGSVRGQLQRMKAKISG